MPRRKFEDANDPERSRALDYGTIAVVGEGRRIVRQQVNWFLQDRSQSIVINVSADGKWTATIEGYTLE
jgi:hypothetical protein